MKKIIFLALIGYGAWNYFGNDATAVIDEALPTPAVGDVSRLASVTSVPRAFSCDGRVYCSDMTSRAEAEYFTKHCPGTKMDGDHDGIPCENDSRF